MKIAKIRYFFNTQKNMNKFSFKKGFGQLQVKDVSDVKSEISIALNIRNRTTWYNRLNGDVEPKISEVTAIEEIFKRKGITQIWGE